MIKIKTLEGSDISEFFELGLIKESVFDTLTDLLYIDLEVDGYSNIELFQEFDEKEHRIIIVHNDGEGMDVLVTYHVNGK